MILTQHTSTKLVYKMVPITAANPYGLELVHQDSYFHNDPVAKLCCGGGPSAQQEQIAADQNQMMQQYMQESSQYFSTEMGVIGQIQSSVTPILQAGPNQQGFSGAEQSVLNSSAISDTANQYHSAAVTSDENSAAGSGNTYAPSGGTKELNAAIATAGSEQTSGELNQIQQANYATGRQNYWNAEAALGNVSGQLGSGAASLSNTSVNAGTAAFNSASTIQQLNQQNIQSAIGAGMSLASMAMGGVGGFEGSAGGGSGAGGMMSMFQGMGFGS